MEAVTHTLVALGPEKRPSIFKWLNAAIHHVYIGPPTQALLGSGDDHDDFDASETTASKFIHFHSAGGIEIALKDFGWQRGVAYHFGYHVGLLPQALVRLFGSKLVTLLRSVECIVSLDYADDNVQTVFLAHVQFDGEDIRYLKETRKSLSLGTQQNIFIGFGSFWDDIAQETTHTFKPLVQAAVDATGLCEEKLLRTLEWCISEDPRLSEQWMVIYRYRLMASESLKTFLHGAISLLEGARFWIETSWDERHGRVGQFEFRPDLKTTTSKTHVLLRGLLDVKTVNGMYTKYPGLLRMGPILDILMKPGMNTELRYEGGLSPVLPQPSRDERHEDEEHHIVVSAICLSCARIMPDLNARELAALRDPERTREIRLRLSRSHRRPFYVCCYEAMMNPVHMDIPNWDPLLYNINPALPPTVMDTRTIISDAHYGIGTTLWEAMRLVWSTATGIEVERVECVSVRRYVVRYNLPQVSLKDYGTICANPEGFVDHMATFHYNGGRILLDCAETRVSRPVSEFVWA
jgi:hypothetical protein